MKPAWRGFVLESGEVWAWPTALFTHNQALNALPLLGDLAVCRWRQWNPDGPVDFDPGSSDSDKAIVNKWLEAR